MSHMKEDMELREFDFASIAKATDNFASYNKLGKCGFGPVYKGTLVEGQEIAVKRLSKGSGQGMEEFKTEVTLIARLQLRNLVKLLGCCIQADESIGYMSPEFAAEGLFSVISDVFSFGVLILDIAWILWKEKRAMELAGDTLADSHPPTEVYRCIHVGLLCVQHRPEDRPNMSSVVLMLSNDSLLPEPNRPGFFYGKKSS
ncbi:hypothetical protein AB3S75_006250 [Citrus x aurantiifolia]